MTAQYLTLLTTVGVIALGAGTGLSAAVFGDTSAAASAPEAIVQQLAQAQTTRFPAVYTENGLALDGQDVVAYFTQGEPVAGSPAYSHTWNGTQWLFSSAENRDLFAQNPEAYAPQYGGYCAKAAAGGVLATTVPTAWQVIDGKLYLNYSAAAQMEFMVDTPTKIRMANANWPAILNNEDLKE